MANITANTGSNNWNTNGAWVGNVQPTAADNVTIPASAVVTIPTATTALARSVTVQSSGTLAFASTTAQLTIGDGTAGTGNVAFSNAGTITLTGVGTINLVSTSATVQTITTGGQTLPNVTINCTSNGSYQLSDAMTISSTGTMTLTKGTLDTNGQTCSWGVFASNNSNVRTLTLGASNITITGSNATPWNFSIMTNLTFNANTSTITINNNGTQALYTASSVTFYNLSFPGSGTTYIRNGGTLTCNNFTRTGTAQKIDTLVMDSNLTVNGSFLISGNSTTNRVLVASNTLGTAVTITAASISASIQNVDFQDIVAAGAAGGSGANSWDLSAITGKSGDCGGNSGLFTFTPSASQTFGSTGTVNWSAATWTSRVPLPQDDVVINYSGGTATTLTADMPRLGRNIDFTSYTKTFTVAVTTTAATSIFGNVTFSSTMTYSSAGQTVTLSGRGSQTITSNGKTLGNSYVIDCGVGTYTLQDALSLVSPRSLTLNSGTFNANNFNVSMEKFISSNTATRTLAMGSGTWSLITATATTVWTTSASTGLTVTGTAIIDITGTDSGTKTVLTGNASLPTIRFIATGSGGLTFGTSTTSNNNTLAGLIVTCTTAKTISFLASSTTTVTGTCTLQGSSGQLLSMVSSSPSTSYTLVAPASSTFMYINPQDCSATNPVKALFSTDNSRNTGITILPNGGNLASQGTGG